MYKNVLFATPRRGLIDIVVRHLLHVEFKMRSRGYALVYLIFPSDFSMEGIVTPFAGHLKFGPPSKWLTDAYEQKREEHGRKLLEKSKKIVDAAYQKFEEGIDRTLKSKTSWEDKLEIGRKFLPLCLDQEKLRLFLERGYEGRGVVDMMKFRNLCNFAHSESYFVRDALLKELKDKALGKVESKDSKEEKS